jgi:hypothetical protein
VTRPGRDVALVVLAAGRATRFGRLKQLEPVGPAGQALMDYALFDARGAGFSRIVLVVAPGMEETFHRHVREMFGDTLAIETVVQRLDDLAPGYAPPADRQKPWGTAHAVLAAPRTGPCSPISRPAPSRARRSSDTVSTQPSPSTGAYPAASVAPIARATSSASRR